MPPQLFLSLMFSLLFFLLFGPAFNANADCMPQCSPRIKAIESKRTELSRIKFILQKNEDYLMKYPKSPPSIVIKIRSNILMSKLQMETLDNQISVMLTESSSKGCGECH